MSQPRKAKQGTPAKTHRCTEVKEAVLGLGLTMKGLSLPALTAGRVESCKQAQTLDDTNKLSDRESVYPHARMRGKN